MRLVQWVEQSEIAKNDCHEAACMLCMSCKQCYMYQSIGIR